MDGLIKKLYKTICSKKTSDPEISYTAKLFKKGRRKILKKFGEESGELIIGAAFNDRENVIYESVDVLYHMMVLWSEMDIEIEEIEKEIIKRTGISGLEEKANREKNV